MTLWFKQLLQEVDGSRTSLTERGGLFSNWLHGRTFLNCSNFTCRTQQWGHIINVTIRMDFTDHHFFWANSVRFSVTQNSDLIFSSSNAKIMRKYDFLRSVCPSLWKVNRIIFTAGAKAKRIHNSFFCKIELASRLSNWVELGKSSWSTANLSNARTGLGISTNNRFFLLFQDAE